MDVAFTVNPSTGKLTFARDKAQRFYLDNRQVYAVIATLFGDKGRYGWDLDFGTRINSITKDTSATGSRLTAAAADAFDQLKAGGYITAGSIDSVTRLRSGVWGLALRWRTSSGESVALSTRA